MWKPIRIYHFTPLNSLNDISTHTDDDSNLVADVDLDALIRIVRSELKNGKTAGVDKVYNEILKKAVGTGIYTHLARTFTLSSKLGYIPYVWKIVFLRMLIKPDKLPSQTASYRPISLLSPIMKLFESVIEKRLQKHLEDNGFFGKYQSGFRKSKSTNDYLVSLSQTIMESFNRGEHVISAVEKACIRQCLVQWTQVRSLSAWSAHKAMALQFSCRESHTGQS